MIEEVLIDIQPNISDFNNFINEGNSLILIYASWCPHCKVAYRTLRESDEFKDVTKRFKIRSGRIEFFDAIKENNDSSEFEKILMEPVHDNGQSFPTFAHFKNGKYTGKILEFNSSMLVNFIYNVMTLDDNSSVNSKNYLNNIYNSFILTFPQISWSLTR